MKDKEYKRRVWMNKERVETTPHYDDYDNVLFVWTGRKTVHLKEFGTGGFLLGVREYEVANHAHQHIYLTLKVTSIRLMSRLEKRFLFQWDGYTASNPMKERLR